MHEMGWASRERQPGAARVTGVGTVSPTSLHSPGRAAAVASKAPALQHPRGVAGWGAVTGLGLGSENGNRTLNPLYTFIFDPYLLDCRIF